MTRAPLVEPDLDFIHNLTNDSGGTLKKCFQCGTCSVACALSPDEQSFPRKEMIAASWGLKDRLLANHDIWLCHQCGDCSTLCPRGAKPGDVLSAIRSHTIDEYTKHKTIGKLANDAKNLPLLFGIPTILFFIVGWITGLLDFTPDNSDIVHTNFFSHWLVDIFFVPLMFWVVIIFGLSMKRFLVDIHENALQSGKTGIPSIDPTGFIKALIKIIPSVLGHNRFSECTENREREASHMMVLFSFIGLFVVTNIFFITLYVLDIHGPFSQMNPVKWLANISGVALIIGSAMMIKQRREKTEQISSFRDWYLLWVIFGVGLSGMLTEIFRLANFAFLSYLLYYIHLVFVFNLVAFLPYSKLAHLVFRTVAIAYDEYIEIHQ